MKTRMTHVYGCMILCLAGLLVSGLSAQEIIRVGDIINVDFANSQIVSTGGWNTMAAPDGTITNAITSSNKVTTVSFALPVRFNGTNTNGTTAPTGDAAGLPTQATSDSFYGNTATFNSRIDPKAKLLISNLDPALQYELTFFASRTGVGDNRQGQYAISGAGGLVETLYLNPSNNTDKVAKSQLILPTAAGAITVDIEKGPDNNNTTGFFYLGVVTLKALKDPHSASNPNPANGAMLVPSGSQLSWDAPDEVVNPRYNLYWWNSDPNAVKQKLNFAETSADPGLLEHGKTYYWRVDTIDPNNGGPIVWTGLTWSFTVIPATPFVVEHPQSQLVFPGETATFTVVLEDGADVNYKWLKVTDDPNYPNGLPVLNDGRISGALTSTLTIANAGLADEGDYFCRAANDAGPTDTETAMLAIKRLISHWPLDGTLDDVEGGKEGAMAVKAPDFAAGVIADALSLSGGANDWVTAGAVGVSGNAPRSITGWVKATSDVVPTWTGVFGLSNTTGVGNTFFDFQRLGNQGNGFGLHQHGWERPITATYPLGEWVFLAATHDGVTTRWYGNGTLAGGEARTLATHDLFTFGKRGDNANQFTGLIDDVRLYNYALTPIDVAKLWTDIQGGYVCVGGTPAYDLNEDCIVDLADLALFASDWMACHRYPQCLE